MFSFKWESMARTDSEWLAIQVVVRIASGSHFHQIVQNSLNPFLGNLVDITGGENAFLDSL